MKLCRFKEGSNQRRLGVLDESYIHDLTTANPSLFSDLGMLAKESKRTHTSINALIGKAISETQRLKVDQTTLLLPVIPSEIWGAGVTYTRSREARKRETRFGQIYEDVYEAKRPELFLKDASARRCAGPGEHIHVRSDSRWTVPEPELAIVLDIDAKTLGYTIANDVSARDIEGENPLYLPQAKTFNHSCSFGPVITTPDEIGNAQELEIEMKIHRAGRVVFTGKTSTSAMKRPISELVDYLQRDNVLGEITILMTGTGIVPPDDFSLGDGDMVEIEVQKIGVLRNPVRKP